MALSIVTFNGTGLWDQSKRAGLLQWLRSLTAVPDIVCLQECHCSPDLECQACFRASGYQCALNAGSTNACGCIFLFWPTLSLLESRYESDGRFLMCKFPFGTKSFVSAVSTLLIVIQHVISSLTMSRSALLCLSLLCFLVILTLFETGPLTASDQISSMYLANHFVLWTVFLTPALPLTAGGISILHPPVILGPGVMVCFLLLLT